jgi:hypothetical protein
VIEEITRMRQRHPGETARTDFGWQPITKLRRQQFEGLPQVHLTGAKQTYQPDHDQVDGDDVVEQPGDHEYQDASEQ